MELGWFVVFTFTDYSFSLLAFLYSNSQTREVQNLLVLGIGDCGATPRRRQAQGNAHRWGLGIGD